MAGPSSREQRRVRHRARTRPERPARSYADNSPHRPPRRTECPLWRVLATAPRRARMSSAGCDAVVVTGAIDVRQTSGEDLDPELIEGWERVVEPGDFERRFVDASLSADAEWAWSVGV